MKAINVLILCTVSMMVLNALGKLLLDIDPLSIEVTVTTSFAVTWCIFKDRS